MGIGHVAVGLGLKSVDRSLNAGLLIFAALLSDFLLGWFVWAGWEDYQVPHDYAVRHYLLFTFPWSHGLLPGVLLGLAAWKWGRRAAFVVGIAATSHYVLDGLVHVRGLPVAGPGTPALGLGLWNHLPLELALEAGMAIAGLAIYLRVTRRVWMAVYVVLLGAMTIAGQATATEAPGRPAMIASWIGAPVVFAAIAWVIDRYPRLRW